MEENSKITVKALGHEWVFGPTTVASDYARRTLEGKASAYLEQIERPADWDGAYDLLVPFYKDVLSAAISATPLEGVEPTFTLRRLIASPALWVELAGKACNDFKSSEIEALWRAATEVNTHWYPAKEETAPDGYKETELTETEQAELANANALLDPENETAVDLPDSEVLKEAADKLVKKAERKAKGAGKIGPETFSGESKG